MEYGVYAIFDKLNGFTCPNCDHNDNSACRNFNYAVTRQNSVPASDLELYRLGTFNSTTGVITALDHPVLICRGVDCE